MLRHAKPFAKPLKNNPLIQFPCAVFTSNAATVNIRINISTRKTELFVFLVLMPLCLCSSENQPLRSTPRIVTRVILLLAQEEKRQETLWARLLLFMLSIVSRSYVNKVRDLNLKFSVVN